MVPASRRPIPLRRTLYPIRDPGKALRNPWPGLWLLPPSCRPGYSIVLFALLRVALLVARKPPEAIVVQFVPMDGGIKALRATVPARAHFLAKSIIALGDSSLEGNKFCNAERVRLTGPQPAAVGRLATMYPIPAPAQGDSVTGKIHAVNHGPLHPLLAVFQDQESLFAIGPRPCLRRIFRSHHGSHPKWLKGIRLGQDLGEREIRVLGLMPSRVAP